ncbi:MAG: alkaline phosphatase [Lachnospiraceae bacterium]
MKAKKIGALLLAAAMAVCTVPVHGMAAEEGTKTPKYIFLFIGDGMSYPQVQTTNYYLNAIADDGDEILNSESKLNMMKFPVAGSAQTYDSTSFCPDSASTATSISTGHKTYSGTINMDEKMETPYETIAEKLKKQLGYKVGILSSVNLNHATPAAFYAHQASRNSYYEIGEELIASDFDYFAGGGLKKTTGADGDKTDLYQLAEEAGYKVIKTQAEAESLTAEDGQSLSMKRLRTAMQ